MSSNTGSFLQDVLSLCQMRKEKRKLWYRERQRVVGLVSPGREKNQKSHLCVESKNFASPAAHMELVQHGGQAWKGRAFAVSVLVGSPQLALSTSLLKGVSQALQSLGPQFKSLIHFRVPHRSQLSAVRAEDISNVFGK